MSRKPRVFLDGKHIDHRYGIKICELKVFFDEGGSLIDGDILLGDYWNYIYYKKEYIKLDSVDVVIPEKITKHFNDLIDTFRDSAIICFKVQVYLQFHLHETDKTFVEIAQALGREKIKSMGLNHIILIIRLTNHSRGLYISVNHHPNKIEYLKKAYELSFESRISIVLNYKNIKKINENTPENAQCDIERELMNHDIIGFYIDDKQFFTKTPETIVNCITGPQSVVNKKISTLFGEEIEIIYKTQPGIILKELQRETIDDRTLKYISKKCEYVNEQSRYRWEIIKDICIAFTSLALPPYVLLEIIDWLPNIEYERHFKKISLIVSMRNSIRKIQEKRNKLDEF